MRDGADEVIPAWGIERRAQEKPNLGLASTREMLHELVARGSVELSADGDRLSQASAFLLASLPADILGYRTVKGR